MQQFADAFFQAIQVEWLGEEILGLHGGGAFGYVASQGAHENNGDFLGAGADGENFTDQSP